MIQFICYLTMEMYQTNCYHDNLIKEVRLYQDVVLSHIKENLNEWGTNYINERIVDHLKNRLYLNLL